MPPSLGIGTGWIAVTMTRLLAAARGRPLLADAALAAVLAVLTAPDVSGTAANHHRRSPSTFCCGCRSCSGAAPPSGLRRRRWDRLRQWLVGVQVAADAALLVALYTVAAHRSLGRALLAAAVLEFGVLLAVLRWTEGPPWPRCSSC